MYRPEEGMTPEPSGPNNVSSTRTLPNLRSTLPHKAKDVLGAGKTDGCQIIDVPPLSSWCPTDADKPGSGPQRGQCSLERR